MNNTTHSNEDERFLEPFVASARNDADDEAVAQAAERMRQRLPAVPERRFSTWSPRFATAAALIAGLAVTLSLFVPGGSGTAFADVQAWFSSYRTLDVRTTLTFGDQEMVNIRVQTNADGDTRIEQSGVVQILSVSNGTFTTLLPGNRYFEQAIELYRESDRNLEWVEKLRAFRGEAAVLSETRVIDGQEVNGHRLVIDDINLTLWSQLDTHQPVLLEGELPGGLQLETRFLFDVSLASQLFEVPAGFERVTQD
ncbi:MAG: hypothetical protein QNJ05_15245 [Woeseiaceae bacterium]|nr:hypothetical protein [Woeseiaceae bacterium]